MPQSEQPSVVVIRAKHRKAHVVSGNPVAYEWLSPEGVRSLAMFRLSAAPGQSTGANELRHGGDENMLVLSGTFEVAVEGAKHKLAPGDSMFLPRGQRHRVTNVGKEPGEAVFVISPPEY